MRLSQFITTVVLAAVTMTAAAATTEAPQGAEQETTPAATTTRARSGIYSGFSGGMLLHAGYGFANNPEDLFRNGSLNSDNIQNLPKDGFFFGVGGMLRIHLINHIHVGGEGYVSTMPLRKFGQIRSGWGGAFVDFYTQWGKVIPYIGAGIGGGSMRRTFVSETNEVMAEDATMYNASYTRTPFFYIDPMIGLEFVATSRLNIVTRIDYLLPFSKNEDGIAGSMQNWKGFMTPSGPRLYIGIMFGH